MWIIDEIAEARIRTAVERGDLDNLPGAGKPLHLEDDALVPPELRLAYRMLKNADFVPEAVHLGKAIHELEDLAMTLDGDDRSQALKRLSLLRSRLSAVRGSHANLQIEDHYYRKLLGRLGKAGDLVATAGSRR